MSSTDGTFLDQMMADPTADETVGGFHLNKIVAFLGPYIAVISGVVADWLLVHVHVLSTFHLGQDETANAITQLIVFGLTAALVWIGHHKWLDGWQRYEADLRAPMLAEAKRALSAGPIEPPDEDFDPAAAKAEMEARTTPPVA